VLPDGGGGGDFVGPEPEGGGGVAAMKKIRERMTLLT